MATTEQLHSALSEFVVHTATQRHALTEEQRAERHALASALAERVGFATTLKSWNATSVAVLLDMARGN